VAARKRELLGALAGTVVEIGPGTGVNLHHYPPATRWIGVEPNAFLRDRLRRAAEGLGRRVELLDGIAERLPLPDASADAVVSTLVLCTARDPAAALRETLRVLVPGGRFVFLEHVAAPRGSWTRRLQRALRLPWAVLGDGCRPDRETLRAIETAGFARVDAQSFRVPLPVVSPHVAGVAWKEGVA
jgi:SAM-dependent methyltransferase